jgi:hypothetical protein
MPRSRRWTDDTGSASLEFITAGLVLLVPIVYLVLALSSVQAAALGVEGAARQASRVFVQSPSPGAGRAAARSAIAVTLADYGLDAGTATVRISCRPDPAACLTRRGFVTVTIRTTLPAPLMPPFLDLALPDALVLEATATEQVSRFWRAR